MFQESRIDVGGIPISVSRAEDAVRSFIHAVTQGDRSARMTMTPVRFVNSYCIALSEAFPSYREILQGQGMNLADGRPVVWVARRKNKMAEQVRGSDFFREVVRQGVQPGIRHYFFGTDDKTLGMLKDALGQLAPEATIAGMYAPPMGDVTALLTPEVLRRIQLAHPHIVWVGLGTPKQDHVTSRLSEMLHGPFYVGVGAAFDFIAGTKKEAPRFLQWMGLEWIHRLVSEPGRLWRRYLWGNLRFIRLVAQQVLEELARRGSTDDRTESVR